MQYNLAKYSQYTSTGNKILTTNQLIDLVGDNDANITLSGSDIISVDIDLGERILADEVRYYFSSSYPSTSVVSGIAFYAKLGAAESWTALTSDIGIGYYFATITGSVSSPRYVRLTHTISGTSISGSAQGIQVINNEDIVDYGELSDRTQENFNMSFRFNPSDVREIAIYNSGLVNADAYVSIEPQRTTIDNVLYIGTTASGSWHGISETENKICGAEKWLETYDYWSSALRHDNTIVSNDTVILKDTLSGTYTTRIFNKIDDLNMTLLNMIAEYPVLYSGTVFTDYFTGGTSANWTATNCTISYPLISGSHCLQLGAGTDSSAILTNAYANTHDNLVTMKIRWGFHSNGVNGEYSSYAPIYNSSSESVELRVCCASSTNFIRFYINGTLRYTDTRYNAYSELGNWFWFKVQRSFLTLKYKLWRENQSEPDWVYTVALGQSELPSYTNKIRFFTSNYTAAGALFVDNVVSDTNVSSYGNNDMMIKVDTADTEDTIEIKSSSKKPENYHVTISGSPLNSNMHLHFLHFKDSSTRAESTDVSTCRGGFGRSAFYFNLDETYPDYIWGVVFDQVDGYWSDDGHIRLTRYNQKTNTATATDMFANGSSNINMDMRYMASNGYDYCWVYFKTTETAISGPGYYLICYGNALTRLGTIYNSSTDFCKGMCIAAADGSLWYANPTTNAVIKINTSGTVLASYSITTSLLSICSSNDGGCFVLIPGAVYKIKYDGTLQYYILGDFSEYATLIALDKDESGNFWLIEDGSIIRNVFSDGTTKFTFDVNYDIYDIRAVYGGIWLKCNYDYKWRFFDKESKTITKAYTYAITGSADWAGGTSTPAFHVIPWSDTSPDERIPTSVDTHWQNLAWKKVPVMDYSLPSEMYHRVRLTLRASSSGATPILKNFYRQDALKLDDIQPGHYKYIYLNVDISSLSDSNIGNYNSNLKTWWYIPE